MKKKLSYRGPPTPPASHLLATQKEETSRQPLPPPSPPSPISSLLETKQRKLFKVFQNLARDTVCSLLIT